MTRTVYKSRKGVSLIIFIFGVTAILAFASFVIDAAMILNSQNELQKAVESAALVGASNLEPKKDNLGIVKIDKSKINDIVVASFNQMIGKGSTALISNAADPTVEVKEKSKAVRVKSSLSVNTYFVRFIGIYNIVVQAQATAMSAPVHLSPVFPRGAKSGSLITETSGDTDIRKPIGDNSNENSKYDNIYDAPDNKALSLGPGGYITIRLPAPLVDMDGADLYIKELGNIEGYYVFAGNNIDPNNPYIDEEIPGAGIKWVNISCTGIPVGTSASGKVGAYYTTVSYKGNTSEEAKFYGSGYFDLNATCSDYAGSESYGAIAGSVKSAQFLKIIDDNVEDGFMEKHTEEPVLLIGEHSSITPGVDIDAVAVLHHTRLISSADFDKDSDSDGLIDILEQIIGTDPNNIDTDGDSIEDGTEYVGWFDNGGTKTPIIDIGASEVYFTNPKEPDADGSGKIVF